MFTQQCIIHKNTKEIINFLNEIGYTLYEGSDNFSKNVACSCKFNTYFTFDDDEYVFPNTIDCKKNKELFFAVAALRDDSDRFQWFIHEDSSWNSDPSIFWHKCESESIKIDMAFNIMYNDCRKATVEELIKYFAI